MKRTTLAGTGNWTWIKSNTTVVDAQLSANAFLEGGDRKTLATIKSADVGLPAYLDEKCAASDEVRTGSTRGGSCALPIVNFGDRSYQQFGKNAAQGYDTLNIQFNMNVTKVRNDHTLRFGTDMRRHARTGFNPGASQGSHVRQHLHQQILGHRALYRRQPRPWLGGVHAGDSDHLDHQHADRLRDLISVLFGLRPGSLARDVQAEGEHGSAIRVRAGDEGGDDRMIVGFDPDFAPAIADAAVAAYARNPIPELSVSTFDANLRGGAIYAGANGQSRRAWKNQAMWLPRVSMAYQPNDGMVLRGGYGIYYDTLNATAIVPNQLGFSTVTRCPRATTSGRRGCRATRGMASLRSPILSRFAPTAPGSSRRSGARLAAIS